MNEKKERDDTENRGDYMYLPRCVSLLRDSGRTPTDLVPEQRSLRYISVVLEDCGAPWGPVGCGDVLAPSRGTYHVPRLRLTCQELGLGVPRLVLDRESVSVDTLGDPIAAFIFDSLSCE